VGQAGSTAKRLRRSAVIPTLQRQFQARFTRKTTVYSFPKGLILLFLSYLDELNELVIIAGVLRMVTDLPVKSPL
jgi:hypothetical protein